MISPTGQNVRGTDRHGSGRYMAPRGAKRHQGADFICTPGQPVVSPIDGVLYRVARPYADGPFSGAAIRNGQIEIKIFYFMPDMTMIGQEVVRGDVIGTAQDIGDKYPGITPHVHLEVVSLDPELLIGLP